MVGRLSGNGAIYELRPDGSGLMRLHGQQAGTGAPIRWSMSDGVLTVGLLNWGVVEAGQDSLLLVDQDGAHTRLERIGERLGQP